jgi:hypothetical protein
VDPERLDLFFDAVQMVKNGAGCGPDAEAKSTRALKTTGIFRHPGSEPGGGTAAMLTCDFLSGVCENQRRLPVIVN